MKRFKKMLSAMMIVMAAVFVAGCTPEEEPDNDRSSSLCTEYPYDAWNYVVMADQFYKEWRCWGYPVRAVRSTSKK